jgi:hypothetical protein
VRLKSGRCALNKIKKETPMADGGFLIKFDGKKEVRCYKVAFSYDDWTYTTNFDNPKPLPDELKEISVELESSFR